MADLLTANLTCVKIRWQHHVRYTMYLPNISGQSWIKKNNKKDGLFLNIKVVVGYLLFFKSQILASGRRIRLGYDSLIDITGLYDLLMYFVLQVCSVTYVTVHRSSVTAMQRQNVTEAALADVQIRRLEKPTDE